MDSIETIDKLFNELENKNNTLRYDAFKRLLEITANKVPWIYDKWFVLTGKLTSDNSYQRSIGLMLLANLAKSDTENRIGIIIDNYLESFDDEKFITSRQMIQNVWQIAITNEINKKKTIRKLENAYSENIHLKSHGNLIKQDIIFSLCKIYEYDHDEKTRILVNELVDSEIDDKLRKNLKKSADCILQKH